jgi:hypothetical protein
MARNRRSPDIIRIICTDSFHWDSDAWTRYSHHWLLNLRQIEGRDRTRLIVPGAKQRTRLVQVTTPDGSIVLFEHEVDPKSPVKPYRLVGDERYLIFKFLCQCGRDPQRREDERLDIAARHREELPGQRVEIDLVELERRKHVCSR